MFALPLPANREKRTCSGMPVPRKPMLVALIVACAMFMEQLDGTVISTALPAMAKSLGASPIQLNLAITSYMLSLAVFIPVSGWIADRYGARTVFRAAIVIFTVGSALCGVSGSLAALTGSRVLQGIGGAMMVPVGRLVLLRSVTKTEMVQAMAWLMVPSMLGPVIGPPLGGFITTYANWRLIFFINLPIGVLGIALVSLFIPDIRETERQPLDYRGFLLWGASLSGLIFGLDVVGRLPTDVIGWELVAAGIAIGFGAIYHSRHHSPALLDLSLLRVPTFAVSMLGGASVRIGVGAMPFLLPLMLQIGFGMSAFGSGLLTFASSAGSMAMKASAGPFLRWFGFRTVLIVNGVISALSILVCAFFTRATPLAAIFAILFLGGFLRSLQFTSLNVIAYADVPSNRMSAATSLYSMMQQVALGAGVAIGALLLHIGVAWRGGDGLAIADFHFAFAVVALVSLLGVFQFARLEPDAAAEVSGHRPRPRKDSIPAPGE